MKEDRLWRIKICYDLIVAQFMIIVVSIITHSNGSIVKTNITPGGRFSLLFDSKK